MSIERLLFKQNGEALYFFEESIADFGFEKFPSRKATYFRSDRTLKVLAIDGNVFKNITCDNVKYLLFYHILSSIQINTFEVSVMSK